MVPIDTTSCGPCANVICSQYGCQRLRHQPVQPQPAPSPKGPTSWPNPTPGMLNDPTFNAIWNVIKSWDINVPAEYRGYCGATGNHVRAIWDAIMPPVIGCICPPTSEQTCQNPTCPRGPSAHD